MNNSGFILLHRKLLENPVFLNAELLQLFIYCLLKANHEPKEFIWNGKMITINRGQFITGLHVLTKELKQKQTSIYRRLQLLRDLGYISLKSENKFTLLTVCKYNTYQDRNFKSGKQTENKRKTNGKQTETNNNYNNVNNDNNCSSSSREKPQLPQVELFFKEHGHTEYEAGKFFRYNEKRGWKIGKSDIQDWNPCALDWIEKIDPVKPKEQRSKQYKEVISNIKAIVDLKELNRYWLDTLKSKEFVNMRISEQESIILAFNTKKIDFELNPNLKLIKVGE